MVQRDQELFSTFIKKEDFQTYNCISGYGSYFVCRAADLQSELLVVKIGFSLVLLNYYGGSLVWSAEAKKMGTNCSLCMGREI